MSATYECNRGGRSGRSNRMTDRTLSETALDRRIEELTGKIVAGDVSRELMAEYEKLQSMRRGNLVVPRVPLTRHHYLNIRRGPTKISA